MKNKRKTPEQKLMAGLLTAIAILFVILLLLLMVSNSSLNNGGMSDLYKDVSDKVEEQKEEGAYKEGSTGYDEVILNGKTVEMNYSDCVKSHVNITYKLSNEYLLAEEGFSGEEQTALKNILQQYINANAPSHNPSDIQAIKQSMYCYNGYFNTVFCLNEQESIYVEATRENDKVTCRVVDYYNPPTQIEQNIKDEKQYHKDFRVLYEDMTWTMDSQDFPYTKEQVNQLVQQYFTDVLQKNVYEPYLNYFLHMKEYMTIEWPSINCQFSTYKSDVMQLKERLGVKDGEKTKVDVRVKGYRQYNYTSLIIVAEVTVNNGTEQKASTEYVTVGYDDNGMVLVPHDLFTSHYWKYIYLY